MLTTAPRFHAPRRWPQCLHSNWWTKMVPVRPAPGYHSPTSAHECKDACEHKLLMFFYSTHNVPKKRPTPVCTPILLKAFVPQTRFPPPIHQAPVAVVAAVTSQAIHSIPPPVTRRGRSKVPRGVVIRRHRGVLVTVTGIVLRCESWRTRRGCSHRVGLPS